MDSDVKSKYFNTTSSTELFSDLSITGRVFFRGLLASKECNPAKAGTDLDGELILKGVNDAQNDFGSEVTRIKFYFKEVRTGGADHFIHFFDQDGYLEFENGLSLAKNNGSEGDVFGDLKIVVFYTGGA